MSHVITAPTERALLKWWNAKAAELEATSVRTLTCADCGRVDATHYVQPQHPYYADGRDDIARCGDCIDRRNNETRAARRDQLAQRPNDCQRCAARPHTYTYGQYRLCGRCLTRTRREHAAALSSAGTLAIFATGLLVNTSGWKARDISSKASGKE